MKEEVWSIVIALLVMAFVVGFSGFTILGFVYGLLMASILLFTYILVQKLVAYQLGIKINFKLWTFRRYWIRWQDKLSWDFPIWIVLPLSLIVLSDGIFIWTAILVFAAAKTSAKAAKKFEEIKEFDIALIASSSIFAILVLALILKLFGFNQFASIACWFAVLNTLPLGNLNGTKIFFGSKILWIFLAVFAIIILILIDLAHVAATIFIALILAALAAIIFYYFYER
jgi:hypothetical protein